MLLDGEEGGSWEGVFGMKVNWRKGRVEGDNSFSLAEFHGQSIPCGTYNVHLFQVGPVAEDFFFPLRILLLGSVIDSSSYN